MKKLTTLIAISMLLISACSKEGEGDKEELITFTGQILEFCDGLPLANTDLAIWQPEQAFLGNGGLLTYSAKTDGNGNFSFMVEDGKSIEIRVGNTAIVASVPAKKSLDLGTFYANPTTSFVYRIKINNPYQAGDTLNINLGAIQDKIPAPLHDSIFPPRMNYSPLATQTYPLDGTIPISGNVAIFRGPTTNGERLLLEEFIFNLPACNNIDTITIEIN